MKPDLSVGEFRNRDDFIFAKWLHSYRLKFVYEPSCLCCDSKVDRIFLLPESRIIAEVRVSGGELRIKEDVKAFEDSGEVAKPFHAWAVKIMDGQPYTLDVYQSPNLGSGLWSIQEGAGNSAGWSWCSSCGRPFILGAECWICPHCNSGPGFATEDSDALRLRRNTSVNYWRERTAEEDETEETDHLLAEASKLLRRREERPLD
jgi:hypothetical protein